MYELVFAQNVIEELRSFDSAMERRKVLAAIQCLTMTPESPGVGDAMDSQGRINRFSIIGGVAFVYWPDITFGKLRILSVQSLVE